MKSLKDQKSSKVFKMMPSNSLVALSLIPDFEKSTLSHQSHSQRIPMNFLQSSEFPVDNSEGQSHLSKFELYESSGSAAIYSWEMICFNIQKCTFPNY
jgi:hypothetical protein